MRKVSLFFILVAGLLSSSCDMNKDVDSLEGASCASQTGTWYVQAVTCDGTSISPPRARAVFNGSSRLIIATGTASCTESSEYSIDSGVSSEELSLSSIGNVACSANGGATLSCSAEGYECDSSDIIDGQDNSYASCSVRGDAMTLSRKVVAVNSSTCAEGEVEELVLGREPLPGLARLAFVNSDPYNYGLVFKPEKGTKSFTIKNRGYGIATDLSLSDLSAPLQFAGGKYPGLGGTCGRSLKPEANCSIVIDFVPTAADAFNQTLVIEYGDGSSTQSTMISLQGQGA